MVTENTWTQWKNPPISSFKEIVRCCDCLERKELHFHSAHTDDCANVAFHKEYPGLHVLCLECAQEKGLVW